MSDEELYDLYRTPGNSPNRLKTLLAFQVWLKDIGFKQEEERKNDVNNN